MSVDRFYREFEAAFRGDRAEILQRLAVYDGFLRPLREPPFASKALDLGCGRGEWLELLGKLGFSAHGVDLDAGMLQDCFERGLSAEQGDAIAYLKRQADSSLSVVSGFHIAEHLPFAVLQDLIGQALRVLQPGGLLILETPNPENLRVGTMSFHMDPTHNKPLPPGLLSFLARHHGFRRVEVLRLQENAQLREAGDASLMDVFTGVSPDYAIVAQKDADAAVLQRFDAPFARDRGLTLETLSQRFEGGFVGRSVFEQAQAIHTQQLGDVYAELADLRGQLRDAAERSAALRAELEQRLGDIQASTSWRVTAPLRGAGQLARTAKAELSKSAVRERLRPLVSTAALAVHKRPAMRKSLVRVIRMVPGMEARLRAVLAVQPSSLEKWQRRHVPSQLTPRGVAVREKLKKLQDR